jgi:hypothetical protein
MNLVNGLKILWINKMVQSGTNAGKYKLILTQYGFYLTDRAESN